MKLNNHILYVVHFVTECYCQYSAGIGLIDMKFMLYFAFSFYPELLYSVQLNV